MEGRFGGGGVRVGWGCQGGCDRGIEVSVKIKKKWGGGVGGSGCRVRVDLNEELKFL